MPEFFEYDPLTGIRIDIEEDSGVMHIHRSEDVEGLLKRNAIVRNAGLADVKRKDGIFFRFYCAIPVTVQLELLNKGINIHNPDHAKRMFQEIESNYKYLKLTDKVHVPR